MRRFLLERSWQRCTARRGLEHQQRVAGSGWASKFDTAWGRKRKREATQERLGKRLMVARLQGFFFVPLAQRGGKGEGRLVER